MLLNVSIVTDKKLDHSVVNLSGTRTAVYLKINYNVLFIYHVLSRSWQ
jgi:hypothetical protein